jgi:hypothetical protein
MSPDLVSIHLIVWNKIDLHLSEDLVICSQYQCSSQEEEVPKIKIQDVRMEKR